MRNSITFIVIVCLLVSCNNKAQKADLGVSDNVRIQFVDSVVDWGDIKDTVNIPRHTFVVRNAGKEPLVLKDVHTSCGCVKLTGYTHEPIQPGKTGTISVSFDPKSQTKGVFSKSVEIHSNAINYVEATVKGNNLVE